MPTGRMPGRKAERVGHRAQRVPRGGGVMGIMGTTRGTLHSQCGSEGESPVLGTSMCQACCESPAGVGTSSPWAGGHKQQDLIPSAAITMSLLKETSGFLSGRRRQSARASCHCSLLLSSHSPFFHHRCRSLPPCRGISAPRSQGKASYGATMGRDQEA